MKRTRSATTRDTVQPASENVLLSTPKQKIRNHLSRRKFKVEEDAQRFAGRFASVVIAEKSETTPTTPQTPDIFNNALLSPQKTPSKITFLSPTVAVKTQRILEPKNINETSYRELKILRALSKLKRTKVCANFVEMHDFFKTTGDEENDENPDYQYMNYMLERGDMSLHAFTRKKKLSVPTYKTILFQILFGLHIAQRELEFQHNDLHAKNVLVKYISQERYEGCAFYMRHEDAQIRWHTSEGFVVKLTDFGHSRIKLSNNEVICNNKDPFCTIFDPKLDSKKIESELRNVKIDWTGYEHEKKVLTDLKSKMKDDYRYPPSELILHAFFDSLRKDHDMTVQERRRLLHFDRIGDFADELEEIAQKENQVPSTEKPTQVRTRRRKRLSDITNAVVEVQPHVVEKRKLEDAPQVRVVRRRTRLNNNK
jgi:hypothetical protein